MLELWNTFFCFFIPGIIGFGGGPGSIGIIQNQAVVNYNFVTSSQFNQLLGLCQALPGPIATTLAFSIGYVNFGMLGGIIATIGIILPSIIIIILLYTFLVKNKDDYRVKRISKFIIPLVIALFTQVVFSFFLQSFADIDGNIHTIILILISFVAYALPYIAPKKFKYDIHPLFIIVFSMLYGYFII